MIVIYHQNTRSLSSKKDELSAAFEYGYLSPYMH
jgi:hypothetical protein